MDSVVIVIAIVPVALVAPATLVLVPPAMMLLPAPFAGLAQFAALVIRLPAIASVMFDRFVQFMFSVLNAPLTSLVDLLS
jgi:hypothetical protein